MNIRIGLDGTYLSNAMRVNETMISIYILGLSEPRRWPVSCLEMLAPGTPPSGESYGSRSRSGPTPKPPRRPHCHTCANQAE